MRARRRSQGSPERSASSSAWSRSPIADRDARDPVAAAAEPEEHVGAVDVGELRQLGELARRLEHVDRVVRGAELLERPALARERPQLELGEPSAPISARASRKASTASRSRCASESASARASCASTRVRTSAETPCWRYCVVDAEPLGEPGDRVRRRARLAPLDLADVLLREAGAGELRLRQARRDAQRAHALADAARPGRGRDREVAAASRIPLSLKPPPARPPSPDGVNRSLSSRVNHGEVKHSADHLTELLDFFRHGPYSHGTKHRSRRQEGARGATDGSAERAENSVTGPQSHELRPTPPRRVASFETPPEAAAGGVSL